MPSFGEHSRVARSTLHPTLRTICNIAIEFVDFRIETGHRGKRAQNRAYDEGNSKLRWPDSRHNSVPSTAMDLVPFPVDWEDIARFEELADVVKKIAKGLGVKLSWGVDLWGWDHPHYQLDFPT